MSNVTVQRSSDTSSTIDPQKSTGTENTIKGSKEHVNTNNNNNNSNNITGPMNGIKSGGRHERRANRLHIPTIALEVPEGREHLTAKAVLATVYR